MQPESLPAFTNLGFLGPDSRKPLPGLAQWRTQTRLAVAIRAIEELLRERCRQEMEANQDKAEAARRNYESMQGSIVRESLLLEQLLNPGLSCETMPQEPLRGLQGREVEKAILRRKAALSALQEFSLQAQKEQRVRLNFLAGWQRLADACFWHSTFPEVPEERRSHECAAKRQAKITQWVERNRALLSGGTHPLLSEIPALAEPLRELSREKSRLEIKVKGRMRPSARATLRSAI